MNLDELAQKHGGYYGNPKILKGTPKKPEVRIAFLNEEHVIGIEIDGEAEVYTGNALPNS